MDRRLIAKLGLSVFVTGLLAFQLIASLGLTHRYRYWPFLSYPMYNNPHREGETVADYLLVGVHADGRETPITAKDLGYDFWRYLRGPVRAALRDEAHALLSYVQAYDQRTGGDLVAIRLENRPVMLVNGRVERAATTSKTIRLREK